MALLLCPECRNLVSSHAASCPHCGLPLPAGSTQTQPSVPPELPPVATPPKAPDPGDRLPTLVGLKEQVPLSVDECHRTARSIPTTSAPGRDLGSTDPPGLGFPATKELATDRQTERKPKRAGNRVLFSLCSICTLLLVGLVKFRSSQREPHPLVAAAYLGDGDAVRSMVSNGVDVNQTNSEGLTPLLAALKNEDVSIARLLLEKGANPNVRDAQGQTALWFASYQERSPELVALLLQRGATNWDDQSSDGRSAGAWARSRNETNDFGDSLAAAIILKHASERSTIASQEVLSRTEWKNTYSSCFPTGSIVTVAKFRSVFGEPSRIQTQDQRAFWYYECSDGTIQVVLNDPDLLGSAACVLSIKNY